jgi:hypothetical protein
MSTPVYSQSYQLDTDKDNINLPNYNNPPYGYSRKPRYKQIPQKVLIRHKKSLWLTKYTSKNVCAYVVDPECEQEFYNPKAEYYFKGEGTSLRARSANLDNLLLYLLTNKIIKDSRKLVRISVADTKIEKEHVCYHYFDINVEEKGETLIITYDSEKNMYSAFTANGVSADFCKIMGKRLNGLLEINTWGVVTLDGNKEKKSYRENLPPGFDFLPVRKLKTVMFIKGSNLHLDHQINNANYEPETDSLSDLVLSMNLLPRDQMQQAIKKSEK